MKRKGTRAGAPWVIKIGGRELEAGPDLEVLSHWLARLRQEENLPLVVVHGGGDEISRWASRLGIPTEKVDGQRRTTPELLTVVEAVLTGPVQQRLLSSLERAGLRPLGTTGTSGPLVQAHVAFDGRLGRVGEPSRVNAGWLQAWLSQGLTPVLAPLARAPDGGTLNVNADLFAGAIAGALHSPLLLLTDVPGVQDASGRYRVSLDEVQARGLLTAGAAREGMIPKLNAALSALSQGTPWVAIGQAGAVPSQPFLGTGLPGPVPSALRGTRPAARPSPTRVLFSRSTEGNGGG
jgi:acetylglutamate kinase